MRSVVRGGRSRTWLVLVSCFLLVGIAVTLYALPEIVRRVAIARIEALTGRPAGIERVDINLVTGRFTIRGFHLAEREGQAPFADVRQLDLRLHLPSLVVGHLWIREMALSDSTVRVVRLATNEFNFSDLLRRSDARSTPGRDVTVDHFVLRRGTVTLEDRALPQTRTWTSHDIAIEARNVSTRRNDGTAVGRSVTAGAPVSVAITDMRLSPIHLRAKIAVRNGALAWRDLAIAPAVRLDVASIDASIKGIAWPLRGPAIVRVGARPPGGGRVQVTGRVDLDPVAAELRVAAKDAELAPYQPYLPTPARISGAADVDLALVVPSLGHGT